MRARELTGVEVYDSQENYDAVNPMVSKPTDGQRVIIWHPFGGWVTATVREAFGAPYAEDKHHEYLLSWCESRKCWVSTGAVNKDAVKKLELGR